MSVSHFSRSLFSSGSLQERCIIENLSRSTNAYPKLHLVGISDVDLVCSIVIKIEYGAGEPHQSTLINPPAIAIMTVNSILINCTTGKPEMVRLEINPSIQLFVKDCPNSNC